MTERAVALLEVGAELHRRGLGRVRLMPYMAPSGLYWRLRLSVPGRTESATWSTSDVPPTADEVLAAHPWLADGAGADPAYTAWVRRVAELARQGWVAYFFADWPTEGMTGVPLLGPEEGRPVLEEPPGGR